jgi:hypothetical protein
MNKLISSLFHGVDDITKRFDWEALDEVAKLLSGLAGARIIRQALNEWLTCDADVNELGAMARETSTHYVWPLHSSSSGYSVAINEFKASSHMTAGYATTLHNHRYSFISLMMSGGYVQVRSYVEFAERDQVSQISDIHKDVIEEGDIVFINHDEYHRLAAIKDRTVTLVVKCPAAKRESVSIDTGTLRITRHVPAEARIAQLIEALVQDDE